MKTTKLGKLAVLLTALVLVFTFTACDNTEQPQQATPTMAPDNQESAQETDTTVTGDPTPTPDPIAALRYWEIDPDKTVYNILLLGMGQEEPGTIYGHNDTTMILQINLEKNEMRLVSFMRDMLVDIPGKSKERINNTHLLGGPDLVKRTMKSVFGVDIDYYATVNFVTFEQIMRIVGTIVIDVQEHEVAHLQKAESAVSIEGEMILGQGVVQNKGTYEFNEYLALSYARDRHSERTLEDGTVVYSDRGRNERQREVVKAAWTKVKSKPVSMIPASVFLAMAYVETDMNEALIITLLKQMMENSAEIVDMSVPDSNWEEWKAEDGTQYTNDELKSLYSQKKAQYEASHQPASTEPVEGEVTTEPAESAEVPAFPSYETWRKNENFASVIEWSHNKTISELHEFLGID